MNLNSEVTGGLRLGCKGRKGFYRYCMNVGDGTSAQRTSALSSCWHGCWFEFRVMQRQNWAWKGRAGPGITATRWKRENWHLPVSHKFTVFVSVPHSAEWGEPFPQMTVVARGKEFTSEILCWKQLQGLHIVLLLHKKYHSLKNLFYSLCCTKFSWA